LQSRRLAGKGAAPTPEIRWSVRALHGNHEDEEAGPRLELGEPGYEPGMLPLHHPAADARRAHLSLHRVLCLFLPKT